MVFDDKFVYTGGWDKRIFRYDIETLTLDANCMFFESKIKTYAHSDFVKSLCISEDKKYLFSGSADGILRRWELPTSNEECYLNYIEIKLLDRFINSI